MPFLYNGIAHDELPPMARVLTVNLNNEAVAYPYDTLKNTKVLNVTFGGEDVVIIWTGVHFYCISSLRVWWYLVVNSVKTAI